jgi:hypothetical protein
MANGIYGSNKNVRNSVLTEFRGYPTSNTEGIGIVMKDKPRFIYEGKLYSILANPIFVGIDVL